MPNFFMKSIDKSIVLYGKPNAVLDSLNLVSFVFLLEEEIESVLNKKIIISTQDVLNTDNPPFSSVENLSEFILKKIEMINT